MKSISCPQKTGNEPHSKFLNFKATFRTPESGEPFGKRPHTIWREQFGWILVHWLVNASLSEFQWIGTSLTEDHHWLPWANEICRSILKPRKFLEKHFSFFKVLNSKIELQDLSFNFKNSSELTELCEHSLQSLALLATEAVPPINAQWRVSISLTKKLLVVTLLNSPNPSNWQKLMK